MSLTRGTTSNFPCPHCFIHTDKQGTYPPECGDPRTSAHAQQIVRDAQELRLGRKEELLKSFGLQDVDVCAIFSFPALTYDVPNRTCSGKSQTQIHTKHYPLTASTPSPVVFSDIFGLVSKLTQSHSVERPALWSMICTFPLFDFQSISFSLQTKVRIVCHHGGDSIISIIILPRTLQMGPSGKICPR